MQNKEKSSRWERDDNIKSSLSQGDKWPYPSFQRREKPGKGEGKKRKFKEPFTGREAKWTRSVQDYYSKEAGKRMGGLFSA